MAFESLSSLAIKRSGRVSGTHTPIKSVSIVLYKTKTKGVGSLSIRIQSGVMEEIRYLIGDSVDVLIDREQSLMLIKRVNTPCYKISSDGGKRNTKYRIGKIQCTPYPGFPMPKEKVIIDQVICTPDGILCELPPDMEYME
jgi:hypothetical protein